MKNRSNIYFKCSLIACAALFFAATQLSQAQITVQESGWAARAGFDVGGMAVGSYPGSDIDGDGNREFVILGRWEQQVSTPNLFVFESTFNDVYQKAWTASRPGDARYWQGPVTVGDSDGDGNMEIIVGLIFKEATECAVQIYEFDPSISDQMTMDDLTSGILTAADNPTTGVRLSAWFDGGTPNPPTSESDTNSATEHAPSDVEIGDLDGDGNMEVIIGSAEPDNHGLIIYESTGDDSYAPAVFVDVENGVTWLAPVDDYDNDGQNEIAVLAQNHSINIYTWNGVDPPALEAQPLAGSGTAQQGRMDLGDIDGDGDLEIIAANPGLDGYYIAFATAPNTYDTQGLFPILLNESNDRSDTVAIVNPDGEGPASVLLGYDVGANDTNLYIADYTGSGNSFTESDFSSVRVLADILEEPETLSAIDVPGTLDGDNFVDIVVGTRFISTEGGASTDNEVWVIENTQVQVSGEEPPPPAGVYNWTIFQ